MFWYCILNQLDKFLLLLCLNFFLVLQHMWLQTPLAHHAVLPGVDPWHWSALWGVSVAEAAPSDHQLVDGVVIFLQDVKASVQQVVSQSVELGEVDTQVGDTQQFCDGENQIDCLFHNKTEIWLVCKQFLTNWC